MSYKERLTICPKTWGYIPQIYTSLTWISKPAYKSLHHNKQEINPQLNLPSLHLTTHLPNTKLPKTKLLRLGCLGYQQTYFQQHNFCGEPPGLKSFVSNMLQQKGLFSQKSTWRSHWELLPWGWWGGGRKWRGSRVCINSVHTSSILLRNPRRTTLQPSEIKGHPTSPHQPGSPWQSPQPIFEAQLEFLPYMSWRKACLIASDSFCYNSTFQNKLIFV